MSEVLAKVTTRTLDIPRGPDVEHRIRVPRVWFESGAVVEFELPRNLACAACKGGGCDVCGRAGAITLRGRNELAEILSFSLPRGLPERELPGVVIRIPEQGGLPPANELGLPRGLLLLRVEAAEHADPGVSKVEVPEAAPHTPRATLSLRIPKPTGTQLRWFGVAAALMVLALLALLAFRKLRG